MRGLLAILLALGLAMSAHADQRDPRLDPLFAQLKAASGGEEARRLEAQIWQIWLDQEDEDVRLLLRQGIIYMSRGEGREALAAFDAVIARQPGFAEGWNKRATVNFLIGDYAASVRDIERTLALEPRHFGALSGLGQIHLALGNEAAALKAFEAALAIDPHLDEVREIVEELRLKVGGKPI